MHCAGCLRKIEKGLENLEFVDAARANLSTRRVTVSWRPDAASGVALSDALTDLGFENTLFDLGDFAGDGGDKTAKRLALAVAAAGFGAANIMLLSVSVWSGADETTRQLFHLISGLIAVPVVAYSGRPFFASALGALRVGRLNMDVPISLAVLLALGMSLYESLTGGEYVYFDASVTLLFFLLIGRTLDHMMREKARGAITRLSRLAAKGAFVLEADGTSRYVPLSDIEPAMTVLVPAGERIPVDGTVGKGSSDLDRSLVTGESLPVPIGVGDAVEAGTLNLTGPLELRVTKTAANSFLAEIVSMMEAAEQGKATFSRIADRAAAIYAPAVHLIALATFIGWMAIGSGDWHTALLVAISVLIITCPCALGLAVPIVHVVAANRLMKHGIMIKDGAALEKLCDVDTIVFDKTGTLTMGTPRVADQIGSCDSGTAGAIAALASQSTHPAAKAVAAHFGDNTTTRTVTEVREVPGSGISALIDGREARLGRAAWAFGILEEPEKTANVAEGMDGGDVVFACRDGSAIGFALKDRLRPAASETVKALTADGIKLMILSGDNERAVADIARSLGIDDYRSGQTPADKIRTVEALQADGRHVLMLGDGINDAPALAAGHVSMAPSTGSDVGRLAADLVFMNERLDVIPFTRDIALRTDRLVKQNFALAVLYNCIAVPLSVLGFATPLIAAIAMSASSIAVVANSMRLSLGTRFAIDSTSLDGSDSKSRYLKRPVSGPAPKPTAEQPA